MAKSEMKSVIMIMMIMLMLVFAQANHSLTPKATKNDIPCLVTCGLECAPLLGDPIKYGACMALCQLFCGKKTSQATYVCTRSCTYSKLNNINTDVREIKAIVDSCLKTCSNNM
ncbi:uncharacterized protein LOC131599378 [Vicia villosa]|uniref:uncharacterized protein LOC131599378 n=1 Tax=Vicia villosa TaxID=3911 RepID=UPI00273A7C07|nr:uncharacterized protein LOC131599378 [Vicia villosa]